MAWEIAWGIIYAIFIIFGALITLGLISILCEAITEAIKSIFPEKKPHQKPEAIKTERRSRVIRVTQRPNYNPHDQHWVYEVELENGEIHTAFHDPHEKYSYEPHVGLMWLCKNP